MCYHFILHSCSLNTIPVRGLSRLLWSFLPLESTALRLAYVKIVWIRLLMKILFYKLGNKIDDKHRFCFWIWVWNSCSIWERVVFPLIPWSYLRGKAHNEVGVTKLHMEDCVSMAGVAFWCQLGILCLLHLNYLKLHCWVSLHGGWN